MNSKLSVIVPIYKTEPFLIRCIESIINQTYNNLEIILIDDGSPDNCGQICDDYAAEDDRVKVIHKRNAGISCARNSGLDIASGDYIAYVDSDDHLNHKMFEEMMNYIEKFDLEVIEISPKDINRSITFSNQFVIESPIDATQRILKTTSFSVWRRIFKKSLVKDMRFIPGIIHQDVFYTMDMLKRIKQNAFLDKPLYIYNTDNESIIRSKYTTEKIDTGIRATEYIVDNVLKSSKTETAIKDYLTYYYTDHYFLLSRNTQIDPKGKYRKKLKKTVRESIDGNNASLRSIMVAFLPQKIMEIISASYQKLKNN